MSFHEHRSQALRLLHLANGDHGRPEDFTAAHTYATLALAESINRLADLSEVEPERDPVPYKDFLPAMDASESLGIHPAMPGSPAVAGDLYERDDVETDDGLPSNAEGHVLHGAITDRPVQP